MRPGGRGNARHPPPKLPVGVKLFVAFFAFGTTACTLAVATLLFPGGSLDWVWHLNPEARAGFQEIGLIWSILLMTTVGIACGAAAFGLGRRREWGRRLAIGVLVVNLIGDSANAVARHDPRTLIGLPIGGAMIFYLGWKLRPTVRATPEGSS